MIPATSQHAGIRADAAGLVGDEILDEATSTTVGEMSSTLQEISGNRVRSDQQVNLSRQRSPRAAATKQRKKPRFSTVETRQWSKDDENKFTDVERNLSPLVEPAPHLADSYSGYTEDTSESIHDCFPTGADLCRTPESTGRRDSLQSDIATVADSNEDINTVGRMSADSSQELLQQPFITPDPQRESGSSMAISMPRTDSMPCSVAGSSPCQDADDAENTEEVTGGVLSLSRLVSEDAEHAAQQDVNRDMSGAAGALAARSPARSEASVGDWGKDWDLYEKFKRMGDLSPEDTAPVSPRQQDAEAPRSAQGSPTVDMSHIRERLDSRSSRSSHGSDFEVPEARESFSLHLPICNDGPALRNSLTSPRVDGTLLPIRDELVHSHQAPSASPDSRRSSGFDFEAVNQQWDQQRGLVPASSSLSTYTSAATSSASRCTTSNGLVKNLPGYGLLAGLGAKPQGSTSLFGSNVQRPESPANEKMQVDTSSLGNEDSAPLQCESEFRTLSGESEFSHFEVRTRLSWEEFLDGCGISFPNLEPFNPVSHNESMSMGSGALAFDCSSEEWALQQDRAACLQQFTDRLQEKFEELRQKYAVSQRMWDQSANMPQIAIEQLQAKRNPREEEKFKSRMKDFQSQCKDQAWINWYALKQQWLMDDIDVVKRHARELQQKTERCKDGNRRLMTLKKEVQGQLARLQDREDINDTNEAVQCMSRQAMRLTHQDLHHIQQRLPQAQAELESEQRTTAELGRRVEALRRQKVEAEEKLKEAEHRAALAKLKKISMERRRYSHTCIIKQATSFSGLELELRGGAIVRVGAAVDPGDFVKVSLRPPAPVEESNPSISLPPRLSFGLLHFEWLRSLAGIQRPSDPESLTPSQEATVSGRDVQRLLRRLDVAALRIFDFVRSLKRLRRPLTEVSKVVGELENSKGETLLSLSFELSVIHSHTLSAGGCVTPMDPSKPFDVEASQCVVKIKAALQTFPDFEWSQPEVVPVIGPLNTEAIKHAMHGVSTLQEALAAAIQVMRRTGQRR